VFCFGVLLASACRTPTTTAVASSSLPPALVARDAGPGVIDLVYVDGMSELFHNHAPGEGLWAVWDSVWLSSTDESDAPVEFAPPPSSVWLIGEDAPCRARVVGAPRREVDDHVGTVTIWLKLQGCSNEGWAPIGLVTEERLVQDLTWRPKVPRTTVLGDAIEGPVDPLVERLIDEAELEHPESGKGTLRIEVESVATTPPLVELARGVEWPPDEEGCPSDWTYRVELGFLRHDQIEPFPCQDCPEVAGERICEPCSQSWLAGAIARGDEAAFIVLQDGSFRAHAFVNGEMTAHTRNESMIEVATIAVYDEDRVERFRPPWVCDTDDHP
jgi:hypothetical protein